MQTENNSPILDTSWISVVNSVMFLNRIRRVVGFEFGKETEKDVFRLFTSLGQKKKDILFAFLTQTFISTPGKNLNQVVSLVAPLPFLSLLLFPHHVL